MSTTDTDDHEARDHKAKVNRSLAWISLASSLVALLDFVAIVIILAFWLTPEEYGIAVLAVTLFPILDLATDLGLSAAVIQRDDHTEEKISTVFWLNLAMSGVMFAIVYFLVGPGIVALQGHEIVGAMLKVYALKLIFQNVYFMPMALMRRELRFKELSVIRIIANVAEFAGKIGGAWAGFGIWCFVIGPLARVVISGVGVQLRNPWRPRFVLRIREAMDWAKFGVKTSASQILFQIYTNVDYQVVGHYFGATANAFYRVAYEFVLEPCRIISDVIVQIAFPAFARLKSKPAQLVEQFIQFTRMNLVVMIGFLGIVFVSASELLYSIWADKYLEATGALRVLCAVGVLRALSFVVPPLLDGIGRPTLTLVYTLVASVVLPGMFVGFAHFLGDRFGYVSVAMAWAVGYPIAFVVLAALALEQIQLKASEYLRRIIGIPICAAVAMGIAAGAKMLLAPAPALVRLIAASLIMVGVFFVLLARFEGISPRGVKRAIEGK